MTIVLVTHLMDDVAEYANQVYVMEKGRLVKGGKPSDVFQDVVFMEEVQLGVPKITSFVNDWLIEACHLNDYRLR